MNDNIIKAVMWKEKVCFMRNMFPIVLFYVVLIMGTQLFVSSLYIDLDFPYDILNSIFANNVIVMPAMVIVAVGSIIISQDMFEERREKALDVLLAIGISPKKLWYGKYLFAILSSYLICLFFLIIYIFTIRMLFGFHVHLTFEEWFYTLIVTPSVAFFVLAITAFICWVFKQETTQIVMIIIPLTAYMISFFLSDYLGAHDLKINILISIAVLVVTYSALAIILMMVNHISKERIIEW